MALRKLVANALLPNLERELHRSVSVEVASVPYMVDNLMAGQAFAYQQQPASTGAFHTTGTRAESARLVKVHIPVQQQGLFQDQPSWHTR
jgi:hypothetical protein